MEERIAFITDLHIGEAYELPRGIDTRLNFIYVLEQLKFRKPNFLIIGGDLCFMHPEVNIYLWIKEKLDKAGIPFFIIPGNHDNTEMIEKIFPGINLSINKELFFSKKFYYKNILFLDSFRGIFSDDQFNWLENQIHISQNKDIFLIMHHPPILSHSLHMDNAYAFQKSERFIKLCKKTPEKNYFVFCGHYHIERFINLRNLNVFITPSLFVQIDPDQEKFVTFTSQGIGYREIVFTSGEKWYTNVLYISKSHKMKH